MMFQERALSNISGFLDEIMIPCFSPLTFTSTPPLFPGAMYPMPLVHSLIPYPPYSRTA